MGSGAKAQVFSFLDQWRAFAEHSSSEAQRAAHAQLEPVCASADALCSDLGADAATCLQRDANMAETVRTLEQHSVALNKEVQAALSAHRAEEAAVRNELAALRNRTLDTARKTMAMHKDLHQSKHKHQNKELLQALKQM